MFQKIILHLKRDLADIFFPKLCAGCGANGNYICKSCIERVLVWPQEIKLKCLKVIALTDFTSKTIRRSLYLFKYDFVKEIGFLLAGLARKAIEIQKLPKGILVPVPLSSKRLRWRGYNQAEILSLEFSKVLNLKAANNVLLRVKHRIPQVEIKKAQDRKENVIGAFKMNEKQKHKILARNIVLVDDICTTGATLNECARVLKAAGAKSVKALVLARA